MQRPDLTLRAEARRDLTSRSITIRAATADEATRSVQAVLGSENPVEVYDWNSGKVVEEILVASGARMPAQLPLLANHDRWSLDSVLGSARELQVDGGNITGRLMFAGDDDSQRAWDKVREGHITDVSLGYRVNNATTIQAGQSAAIGGRNYTASPARALRVTTDWSPKEVSLVPIGADQSAKIRSDDQPISAEETPHVEPNETTATEATRSATAVAPVVPTPAPQIDAERIRAETITAERDRVRRITELAGSDVPADVRQRAISEGWDEPRASNEFLTAVRSARQAPPPAAGPAIHSRSLEASLSARSLAAGLIARQGGDPTHARMYDSGRGRFGDALTEQDADHGERFSKLSSVDLARACAQIDGKQFCWDPDEAVRAAVSGSTLNYVFGTSVYAKILQGWMEARDSTDWCADETDVANFLLQEDVTVDASTQLDRLAPGGTANHATLSDKRETYKLFRYAKQFSVDEQDFISDRLGALMNVPYELGVAARRLRPDLVYSLLLQNPTLGADSGALFNSTAITTAGGHANLGTGALSTTTLGTAIQAMFAQRRGNVVLNVRPQYLIVPGALAQSAAAILNGVALAKTHSTKSDPDYVPINPVSNQMLQMIYDQQIILRVDDRIGAAGVYDPTTKAVRAGSDTNWFLSAGGPRTVRIGTRRGTNGQPVMRNYELSRGQWGIGWDINYDICVFAADFPGLYKSTGAA